MKLQCDERILSKAGILLFIQRHLNDCHITVLPGQDGLIEMQLKPNPNPGIKLCRSELQNELLECEFIAERYRATKKLRAVIEKNIIRVAEGRSSDE